MLTNEMTVRSGQRDDAEAIARIHVRAWQLGFAHIFDAGYLASLEATIAERAAYWAQYFDSPDTRHRMVVSTIGEEVAGFANLGIARLHRYYDDDGTATFASNPDAGRGELYAIYVDPDRWQRGAGGALMAEALDGLKTKGFADAVLWVFEENERARRFYEAHGWRADGRHDLYTRGSTTTSEICMVRQL
jgi:ribosomal protein S18 acetylase RimI-like enzyme